MHINISDANETYQLNTGKSTCANQIFFFFFFFLEKGWRYTTFTSNDDFVTFDVEYHNFWKMPLIGDPTFCSGDNCSLGDISDNKELE